MKTITLSDVSVNGRGYYGIGASAVPFSDDLYTYLRITDINDDGTVTIMSNKKENREQARQIIEDIAGDVEIGKIYEGKVVKIVDSGAFVDLPGKVDGFVHISQLANYRVDFVDDVLNEGDTIKVKVIGFDRNNKPKLSYKAVNQKTGEDIENR